MLLLIVYLPNVKNSVGFIDYQALKILVQEILE